jgi:hypothetical protein
MTNKSLPDPEDLLHSAENMPEKVSLPRFWKSISTLRDKGYSWREISEWLAKRGVKVHHSQLHRHAQQLEAGSPPEEDAS